MVFFTLILNTENCIPLDYYVLVYLILSKFLLGIMYYYAIYQHER